MIYWLPENARVAKKEDYGHRNLVTYVDTIGRIRQYVASDSEAKFYEKLFSDLTD